MPFDLDGWNLDVNATEVNLSSSKITSDDLILIVERLKEMPNLVQLTLSQNRITSIEGLRKLVHLTYLDLIGNKLTSIEGLSELVNVTTLKLHGNPIKKIPFSFAPVLMKCTFFDSLIKEETTATVIRKCFLDYELKQKKTSEIAKAVETIEIMHASIQRSIIQKNAAACLFDVISGTVVFALHSLFLVNFCKLWLDRELWVQAFSSPYIFETAWDYHAFIFDTVVQMYLVGVPVLVLTIVRPQGLKKVCGPNTVSIMTIYFILAPFLICYITWWYPLLSCVARCLGTDVETEATQNRLLLLSGMPTKTSNMAYIIAFVRVVVPTTIVVHYSISTFAWYHRYMNTIPNKNYKTDKDYGLSNRKIINAKIETFKLKFCPSNKTILYSEYGFVVLCIAIYSIEHHLNMFDFDNTIINATVQMKDDTIKSIDGYLKLNATKYTDAAVACAKRIDDCHSTNGFTCEEMIAAVQPGGCAGDCDDEIKNNMIQRYNDGEFESLCLNVTSEELVVEVEEVVDQNKEL
jgi:hypothetical protein